MEDDVKPQEGQPVQDQQPPAAPAATEQSPAQEPPPPPAPAAEDPNVFGIDDMTSEVTTPAESKEEPPAKAEEPPAAKAEEPKKEEAAAAKPPATEPEKPPAATIPNQKDFIKAVTQITKDQIKDQLGEEYDEFNPEHQAAFSVLAPQVASGLTKQVETQNRFSVAEKKSKEIISSKELQDYTKAKFENLPFREAMKIRDAEARGDFDSVLNFLQNCKKEFEEKGTAKKKADEKLGSLGKRPASPPPPVLEGAGAPSSGPETEPDDGLALFGIGG